MYTVTGVASAAMLNELKSNIAVPVSTCPVIPVLLAVTTLEKFPDAELAAEVVNCIFGTEVNPAEE